MEPATVKNEIIEKIFKIDDHVYLAELKRMQLNESQYILAANLLQKSEKDQAFFVYNYWFNDYHYTTVDPNGRIHTLITQMPKELRCCFTVEDEPIFEVDIHACQPLQKEALNLIKANLKVNEAELSQKNRELSQLEAKIDSIEEKYISNDMDDTTYRKWKARYESERFNLLAVIDELNKPIANTWSRYSKHLTRLNDIANIYNSGDMNSKKSFINLVFDNQLSYKKGVYRTLFLNPLFQSKAALVKEKGLLFLEQPLDFSGKTPMCAAKEIRTLMPVTGATTSK